MPHYAEYDGRELGKWVQTQRELYKDGRLEQSRVGRLEAIGMTWVLNRGLPRDRHWNTMFEELVRFSLFTPQMAEVSFETDYLFALPGTRRVTSSSMEIVSFVCCCISLSHGRREVTNCKIFLPFLALGMVRAKGSPLGEWVRTQRKKYKEGTLRPDR